jgi:hypothetical protein
LLIASTKTDRIVGNPKKKRGTKAVRQRKTSTATNASKTIPSAAGGEFTNSQQTFGDDLSTAAPTPTPLPAAAPASTTKERKKRGPKKRKHSEVADKTPPSAVNAGVPKMDLDSTTLTAADDLAPSDDEGTAAQTFLMDGMIPDWMLG